jgi:hypothetical protein
MNGKKLGEGLNEIGQHVANALKKTPDDVYVYLEAGDQWWGGAIFENLDSRVVYHEFDESIGDLVLQMWDAADPDKKWSVIHYDIKDGQFDAEFLYTDDMELDVFEHDYREDALVARFGDKEVVYPSADEDWGQELNQDDLT